MSVLYTKATRMMKSASAMSHISSKTEAEVSKRIMLVVNIKNTEIFKVRSFWCSGSWFV